MKIKPIFLVFLLLESLMVSTTILSYTVFINLQIGFLSALFVIFGSFLGYKNMIEKQIIVSESEDSATYNSPDAIDEVDDQFDLYSKDIDMPKIDIAPQVKRKKALKNFINGFSSTLSMLRLGAYLILILGFFYLQRAGELNIFAYLGGLTIGVVVAILIGNKWQIDTNRLFS